MKVFEILLVDDSDSDAELAIRALNKVTMNINITHVSDGPAVLEYLNLEQNRISTAGLPDIILLDLKIPKINGLEILKKLKDNSFTRSIPVIMLTSSQQQEDIDLAYKNGVNSYIVKPVEFEMYTDVLKKVGNYWISVNQY